MIKAPWAPEQVAGLNRWQAVRKNPWGCAVCGATFTATEAGWECRPGEPACVKYARRIAYEFMVLEEWQTFVVDPIDPDTPGEWTAR
jgi:hypothetical protein